MTQSRDSNHAVSIVGGSAAGLYTAYLLARRGVPVHVFEQTAPLDPVSRTLIVTRRMRELLGPVGDRAVVNEIRRFELFTDGRSATIPLRQPDLIIERARIIRALAQHAQACGAELHLGRRFLGLRGTAGGLTLTFEQSATAQQEQVHTRTVVGADGAHSQVARAGGWPRQPTVPLVQAVVRLPSDMAPDTVRVWFVPEDTPYFYWLIPDSPTHGVLGLIGEHGQDTHRRLEAFLERRHLVPQSFQGARIPRYRGWVPVLRHVGGGRVYLVGDAAGQVKVTTVGGIVTGFRGATGVAEAIATRGVGGQLRALRRELDLHLLLRRMLHRFSQADYSRLLDLLSSPVRDSLATYDRDAAGSILWRLCMQQPRFVLLGVRGLLTGGAPLPRRPV